MTTIKVPKEWLDLANKLLTELNNLKYAQEFETLDILWIVEKEGYLTLAYRLDPDIDELYETISNIIKYYEKLMQAINFTKTSNIQSSTGGDCSAF